MQISERHVDDVIILDLKGKLTCDGPNEILRDRLAWLAQNGRPRVILNMEGVPFVDSAGLGALIGGLVTVRRCWGVLRLLNLTSRVHDLMVICKLLEEFDCFDNEADAINSFPEPVAA